MTTSRELLRIKVAPKGMGLNDFVAWLHLPAGGPRLLLKAAVGRRRRAGRLSDVDRAV